ncbi:MAG: hypothetical protein IT237_03445 [Bacteroidia bacterium]|nr:hypothetical protein [Bacteroidia bacterium]
MNLKTNNYLILKSFLIGVFVLGIFSSVVIQYIQSQETSIVILLNNDGIIQKDNGVISYEIEETDSAINYIVIQVIQPIEQLDFENKKYNLPIILNSKTSPPPKQTC